MRKASGVLFALVCFAMLGGSACGQSPTDFDISELIPELVVAEPASGTTYAFGETAIVSWSCKNCNRLSPGTSALAYLVHVESNSGYILGFNLPFTHRVSWSIAEEFHGPGEYFIVVQSDPPKNGKPEVIGKSGIFTLAK